jgi:PEP-CTERM motif
MKKTLPILIVSLLLTASWAMGAASLAFDDSLNSGTLTDTNPAANMGAFASGTGTFTFDVNYTFSGGTSTGLSYWLETEAATASAISISNETYFTFPIAQDGEAKPWAFNDTSGRTSASFLTDQSATQAGDLGATNSTAQAAGTYKVSTLQFTLSGLAPGTYHIETTTASPKVSEGTVNLADNPFSQTVYTFTVGPAVPEPATWSMLGLGGLGSFGLTWLRVRRRS